MSIRSWCATLLLVLTAEVVPASAFGQCPATPDGTVVPLTQWDPPALPGEPTLSISGIASFVQQRQIRSVANLLSALPDYYRSHYGLIEQTRGPGRSSLASPRIVLFGSDARLLMNVSTDRSDPGYERVDMLGIDRQSGVWEPAQIDFGTSPATVRRNPTECSRCHGSPVRPIWGTYLNWPGVIGDDPAPGDQSETLTPAHAQQLNAFAAGQGNGERLNFLNWNPPYRAGRSMLLPDHRYGHALTVSNNDLGLIVAEGVYRRMKTRFPARFDALREELLLLGYFGPRTRLLTREERQRIGAEIRRLGGSGDTIEALFGVLGIDVANDLSLHKLAFEAPDPRWRAGSGELYELIFALVLNDLAQSDTRVRDLLMASPKGESVNGIWECPSLGTNTWDVLRYRIVQGWQLKGRSRHEEHRVFYPIDFTRMNQPVFDQSADRLYEYLRTKISTNVP